MDFNVTVNVGGHVVAGVETFDPEGIFRAIKVLLNALLIKGNNYRPNIWLSYFSNQSNPLLVKCSKK